MIERRKFKGVSLLAIYRDLIDTSFKNLEEYLAEVSSELDYKQRKLQKSFEEAVKEQTDDPEDDIHSYFEDDYNRYFEVFPVHTYNPMLLTLYGQFEHWLKKICEFDSRSSFTQISVSELAGGNYIEMSRVYLEKIARISLDPKAPAWTRIKMLQEIRNRIAHNNANVRKKPDQLLASLPLYQNLKVEPYVELNQENGNFYIKDKKFILEAVILVRDYLFEIINKLTQRKEIGRNHLTPDYIPIWGQEKTTAILNELVDALNLLDTCEEETLPTEFKTGLLERFTVMAGDLTEMLAFFYAGKWDKKDAVTVIVERMKGIKKLREIYEIC